MQYKTKECAFNNVREKRFHLLLMRYKSRTAHLNNVDRLSNTPRHLVMKIQTRRAFQITAHCVARARARNHKQKRKTNTNNPAPKCTTPL